MPRKPSVYRVGRTWVSKAGGVRRVLGNVDEMTEAQARALLPAPLAFSPALLLSTAVRSYIAALRARGSLKTATERARHLGRWVAHLGEGVRAHPVRGESLSAFLSGMEGTHSHDYIWRHDIAVRAFYKWAASVRLIPSVDPFRGIARRRQPVKALTDEEIPSLDHFRKFLASAPEAVKELIELYWRTGARTTELARAKAGDYQPRSHCLSISKHKREGSKPSPRIIILDERAEEIVRGRTDGKGSEEFLFTTRTGKPYTASYIDEIFKDVAKLSGVKVTPYSFRHAFIVDLLTTGTDPVLVAKLAGTSLAMIERIYSRFRLSNFRDALGRLAR